MTMYKYYGLFETEASGSVNVSFPDLAGCLTFGNDLKEALDSAWDALGGYLLLSEKEGDAIPEPKKASEIEVPEGASLILVEVDTKDFEEF